MPHLTPRQKRAQFFFALGHQRRLRIIEVLSQHPTGLTYEGLGLVAGIPEASLSHHLKFLRDADIALRTIKGRYSVYRLNIMRLQNMSVALAKLPSKAA